MKLRRLLLAALVVLGTLMLAELALSIGTRIFHPRLTRTDATLGWKYIPTDRAVTRREGGTLNTIAINADGFRDDAFTTDPRALRIMVLGDSITFGHEADQESTWPRILEKDLRERFHRDDIDVMNFAITGFSTAQELLCLREYGARERPDLVVLAFFEVNDLDDNATVFLGRFVPHFTLDGEALVPHLEPTRGQAVKSMFRDHSALFFAVAQALPVTREAMTERIPLSLAEEGYLSCALVTAIREEASRLGAPLLMLYIRDEGLSPARAESVIPCLRAAGIVANEIPYVAGRDTAPHGHWTAEGNRAAAERVLPLVLAEPAVNAWAATDR